jgi:uncharacterized membrane protein
MRETAVFILTFVAALGCGLVAGIFFLKVTDSP